MKPDNKPEFPKVWQEFCEDLGKVMEQYVRKGYGIPLAVITLADERDGHLSRQTTSTYRENSASTIVKVAILNDTLMSMFKKKRAEEMANEVIKEMGITDRAMIEEFMSGMLEMEGALLKMGNVAKRIEGKKAYQESGVEMYG